MKAFQPDKSICSFSAIVEITQRQMSPQFFARSRRLKQILRQYDEEVVVRSINETTFEVYHNITCFIISDLIRKILGLQNVVIPFSNYIMLDTNQQISSLQNLMRRNFIQFRNCTKINVNRIRVRFDQESRSIDGYLKIRKLGLNIKGFCNQQGYLIEEPRQFYVHN